MLMDVAIRTISFPSSPDFQKVYPAIVEEKLLILFSKLRNICLEQFDVYLAFALLRILLLPITCTESVKGNVGNELT